MKINQDLGGYWNVRLDQIRDLKEYERSDKLLKLFILMMKEEVSFIFLFLLLNYYYYFSIFLSFLHLVLFIHACMHHMLNLCIPISISCYATLGMASYWFNAPEQIVTYLRATNPILQLILNQNKMNYPYHGAEQHMIASVRLNTSFLFV